MRYGVGIFLVVMVLMGINFVKADPVPYPHARGIPAENVSQNESSVDISGGFISKSFLLYLCIALFVSVVVLLVIIYYFYGGFK